MPEYNVRIQVTLTGWHDWEPFGLSIDPLEHPQFGISVYAGDGAVDAQQLVLETCSIVSQSFASDLQSAMATVYEAARLIATARLNELPYQLRLA